MKSHWFTHREGFTTDGSDDFRGVVMEIRVDGKNNTVASVIHFRNGNTRTLAGSDGRPAWTLREAQAAACGTWIELTPHEKNYLLQRARTLPPPWSLDKVFSNPDRLTYHKTPDQGQTHPARPAVVDPVPAANDRPATVYDEAW